MAQTSFGKTVSAYDLFKALIEKAEKERTERWKHAERGQLTESILKYRVERLEHWREMTRRLDRQFRRANEKLKTAQLKLATLRSNLSRIQAQLGNETMDMTLYPALHATRRLRMTVEAEQPGAGSQPRSDAVWVPDNDEARQIMHDLLPATAADPGYTNRQLATMVMDLYKHKTAGRDRENELQTLLKQEKSQRQQQKKTLDEQQEVNSVQRTHLAEFYQTKNDHQLTKEELETAQARIRHLEDQVDITTANESLMRRENEGLEAEVSLPPQQTELGKLKNDYERLRDKGVLLENEIEKKIVSCFIEFACA